MQYTATKLTLATFICKTYIRYVWQDVNQETPIQQYV